MGSRYDALPPTSKVSQLRNSRSSTATKRGLGYDVQSGITVSDIISANEPVGDDRIAAMSISTVRANAHNEVIKRNLLDTRIAHRQIGHIDKSLREEVLAENGGLVSVPTIMSASGDLHCSLGNGEPHDAFPRANAARGDVGRERRSSTVGP